MSGQENVGDKEPHGGRSFPDIHGDFWETPTYFSAAATHDRRLDSTLRGVIVYNLGIISGINEMLLKTYFFGPGRDALDKPENKVEYSALMLRLSALYENYRSTKKLNAVNIIENIEQIVSDLLDFSRKIMKESKKSI